MTNDQLQANAQAWAETHSNNHCPKQMANLVAAYVAGSSHLSDDDIAADFQWLREQCHHESGEDWVCWEVGCLSFTCKDVAVDPGEWETVATDWQVGGEPLPKALIPKTRGQFRRLCELANS